MQIRPDPPATTIPEVPSGTCHDKSQKDTEVYLRIYYDQFHHRWPIIHRPSQEEKEENETDLSELATRMIGAWFLGTSEAVQSAIKTHGVLVDEIMSRLVRTLPDPDNVDY